VNTYRSYSYSSGGCIKTDVSSTHTECLLHARALCSCWGQEAAACACNCKQHCREDQAEEACHVGGWWVLVVRGKAWLLVVQGSVAVKQQRFWQNSRWPSAGSWIARNTPVQVCSYSSRSPDNFMRATSDMACCPSSVDNCVYTQLYSLYLQCGVNKC
jgi:hypothetical protein